jgi:XTP/dITP diphosphohydrolase
MKATLIVASGNQGKVKEIRAILGSDFPYEVKSLKEAGFVGEEPEENGDTYEANAQIKAEYYSKKLNMAVIADDTGLECMDLDKWPGLRSARVADEDKKRRRVLIDKLIAESGVKEPWKARFVCSVCLYQPGKPVEFFEGILNGSIKDEEKGEHGFGFDPIFYLEDGRSLAEVTTEEKNTISHRGIAIGKLKNYLCE